MAQQKARIVREVHDEPHIKGSRITVRWVYERVHDGGIDPAAVADRYHLDIADVYHALAYYHDNPAEMKQVAARHERAADIAREQSDMEPPVV